MCLEEHPLSTSLYRLSFPKHLPLHRTAPAGCPTLPSLPSITCEDLRDRPQDKPRPIPTGFFLLNTEVPTKECGVLVIMTGAPPMFDGCGVLTIKPGAPPLSKGCGVLVVMTGTLPLREECGVLVIMTGTPPLSKECGVLSKECGVLVIMTGAPPLHKE